MSTLGDIIDVTEVVVDILTMAAKVIRGARLGDETAVDQALMEGQEAIKREQDRRKFGRPPSAA